METIKKDTAIITAATKDHNTELWLSAKKIINFLVFKLQHGNLEKDPKGWYQVDMKEIRDQLWFVKNKAIKKWMLQLQNLQLIYDQSDKHKEEWTAFSFLRMVKYTGQRWKKKVYRFKLEEMLERFIKNPHIYAKLHLKITKNFKNKYSINIYEIAKDYLPVPKVKLEIEKFRKLIGCGYKDNITYFFKRVVDPALKEINNQTEINIKYEKEKEWRSYKYIVLKFSYKYSDIRKELINKYKVDKKVVDQVIIKYMDDMDILKKIMKEIIFEYKQWKVRKLGGYTYSLLIDADIDKLREKLAKKQKRKNKNTTYKDPMLSEEKKKKIKERFKNIKKNISSK